MKPKLTFNYEYPPGERTKPPEERQGRKYPLLPVRFYNGDKKTPLLEGLIDTGSDDILIPRELADFLILPKLQDKSSTGMGGQFAVFKTKVGVIIGRGGREFDLGVIEITARTDIRDDPILLGRYPIFHEFQLVIEEYLEKFHLIPKEVAWTKK